MASTLLSVSWSTEGTTSSDLFEYANGGDTIFITYHFDTSTPMRTGDQIFLSNGDSAKYFSGNGTQDIVFKYVVPNNPDLKIADLGVANTSIYDAAATILLSIFSKYSITTYNTTLVPLSSPDDIVIDTITPVVLSASSTLASFMSAKRRPSR